MRSKKETVLALTDYGGTELCNCELVSLEQRQYRCTGCSRIKVKLSYIDY